MTTMRQVYKGREEDPTADCPFSPTGKHEPDWASVVVTYDGDAYIDVSCIHCGNSGCVGTSKTLASNICW